MENQEIADVLDRAADALFIYGRCTGHGQNEKGEMCVRGAIQYVLGENPEDAMGVIRNNPVVVSLEKYLRVHPDNVVEKQAGIHLARHLSYPEDPDSIAEGWLKEQRFPSWIWNDRHKGEDSDAQVIDTLRHCAKDLRNGT